MINFPILHVHINEMSSFQIVNFWDVSIAHDDSESLEHESGILVMP